MLSSVVPGLLQQSSDWTGVCDGYVLRKLQFVQNAAARLITNTRNFDNITSVLRDLRWLPVRQRTVFKPAMPV